jgi:hypothetical protein
MRHLGRKMWRCYYPQNYWVALVGFALVGFALVGFALVGFATKTRLVWHLQQLQHADPEIHPG